MKTLKYINRTGIYKKIELAYIILEKCKIIKKFLETNKTITIYMGIMQGI